MARRNGENTYENNIPLVRGLILYLCLIVLFGCVILIVHASMEEKRIGYRLADRTFDKMRLMDEVRRLNNKIAALESYEHISAMVEQHAPSLGPPRYPAIEIKVEGLAASSLNHADWIPVYEDNGLIARFRKQWKQMEEKFKKMIDTLLE